MALYQSDTYWSSGSLILRSSLSNTSTLLLDFSEPLITTSMSLDHISLAESIPRFPSGRRPPLFALMDLGEEYSMINQETHTRSTQKERIIVTTTPTSPRMKVILEEKIVVDRWTAKVRPQTPPDHVPWGGSITSSPKADDPNKFSGRLDPRFAGAPPARELNGTLQWSRSASKFPRRNVLALNRETLTYGKKNRPTSSGGDPVVPSGGLHEKNTSHCFSFYPITPKKRPSLAVRRGHKAFPLLKINQNLTLDEMLKNLREKCASFSSRVSLPADWFYRPRSCSKDITKPSDTTSSESNSDEDEWAFAEPLMDMINSFSDNLSAHPTLLKDDILNIPILSRDPCGDLNKGSGPRTPLVAGNQSEDLFSCPDPPPSFPLRPSLISPSLRARSPKVKKTVRFVDSLVLPQETVVDILEKRTESASLVVSPPHHQKRQSVVFSALIPPSPPLSVVRSLQTAKPARNSWADTLRNYGLGSPPPPPLPRPFSHRYPTSPKLPLFTDKDKINRPLGGSPLRQSYTYESLSADAEKSPPPFSVSTPHPSHIKRSNARDRISSTTKEPLKISHPIPIIAVPRLKRDGHHMGKDVMGSRNLVVTPLRSIFTKFR
ncbi:hypothetical protein P691DRAFT_788742 [Macrolepiota fuliginosa MF-IS2]|uniref:Uncharacterized protein n=1 Tax=Macrolepiota fuliginosa MF-IS2 TaxID=1400762 RepID=A0A9P5XML5_9AGAR|nr:hypothetical protein P691DRAFT_788742 [Macrolepiota fuliginosa MF-IS2]